eukprot:COSAG02_NODE_5619_length_4178_cov_2.972297_2_plen_67_part_00
MQDNSESHAVPLLTRAVEAGRLAGERGRNPEIVFYLAYAHGRKGRRADAVELAGWARSDRQVACSR